VQSERGENAGEIDDAASRTFFEQRQQRTSERHLREEVGLEYLVEQLWLDLGDGVFMAVAGKGPAAIPALLTRCRAGRTWN